MRKQNGGNYQLKPLWQYNRIGNWNYYCVISQPDRRKVAVNAFIMSTSLGPFPSQLYWLHELDP